MIIVDIETTGLDPKKHGIIDIAAMDFNNPKNFFSMQCKLKEGKEIDSYALKINGYTEQDIRNENLPTTKEVIEKFLEWASQIEDITIAGQNVDFDIDFLKENCKEENIKWVLGHRKVDQHSIAYVLATKLGMKIPLNDKRSSNFNSDVIMEFVGIPPEVRPHKAINGVTWEAEAFSRMINGKKLIDKFEEFEIPKYLS